MSLLLITGSAFAQYSIGFQFSPIVTSSRIDVENDNLNIEDDGSSVRMALGPIVDIQLTDNYYFSSGILFAAKRAGLQLTDTTGSGFKEVHDFQFIQIPLSMKLFTNEVGLDKRVFFQFGGTTEININSKVEAGNNVLIVEDVQFFDFSLLLGAGLEYALGTSTIIYGSFSYHRGLVNAVSAHNDLYGKVVLKNDYVALNIGIKL